MKRVALALASALILTATVVGAAPRSGGDRLGRSDENQVIGALLVTYIHGIHPDMAQELIGEQNIPLLAELLRDPSFPRRDNVVGFLGAFDTDAAILALADYLRAPVIGAVTPEEDRALLQVPQALGRQARRGNDRALVEILRLTDADSGILAGAAARVSDNPEAYQRDLAERALRGLALSDRPEALDRLAAVAAGRLAPAGLRLDAAASQALDLHRDLFIDVKPPAPEEGGDGATTPGERKVLDTQGRMHDHRLTYGNHVSLTGTAKMTDSELDTVLDRASAIMGKDDFTLSDGTQDVACCSTLSRGGTAGTWGSSGDGLDSVDTSSELDQVMGQSVGRVKVVRDLNYCGGDCPSCIGCAYTPGNSMVVVRLSNQTTEGQLWAHEYGHNTGLGHTSNTAYIMHGALYGDTSHNMGLTQSECNTFHSPSGSTQADKRDCAACADTDGDEVHDIVDNCPKVANATQADADGDGVGDACEASQGTCGNGIREGSEQCDGNDVNCQDCASRGLGTGSLTCSTTCQFVETACSAFCPDADGDGYRAASCNPSAASGGGDCNDNDASIHPGAPEICNDGIDQDCDGVDKKRGCPKENCSNGVDDDGDGKVDCADPDCSRSRSCR